MNALKTIMILSLLSLPVMNAAFAEDSTNISAPGVTPVMPKNIVNYSNCRLSAVIKSNAFGTRGPKTAICPPNYVSTGLMINVTVLPVLEEWQTECCPSSVGYSS